MKAIRWLLKLVLVMITLPLLLAVWPAKWFVVFLHHCSAWFFYLLGNMDSLRDWGYAKDYVECMWLIMQQEKPDDFVIATGVQHTVRDFTEKAFAANGITIRWEGTGIDEKGYDAATGKMLVCVNPQWFRPTDVDNLWGDPTKAKTVLGWNPQSTTYEQLVEIMAKHDRERAKREKALKAVL